MGQHTSSTYIFFDILNTIGWWMGIIILGGALIAFFYESIFRKD
jgi:hypothetical protein